MISRNSSKNAAQIIAGEAIDINSNVALGALMRLMSINEQYRIALEDVTNPLGKMTRELQPDERLSGMAYGIAHNLGYVQGIARDALKK